MGEQAMEEFNFQGYAECSAKSGEGLNNVFHEVMKIHFTLQEMKASTTTRPQAAAGNAVNPVATPKKGGFCSVL